MKEATVGTAPFTSMLKQSAVDLTGALKSRYGQRTILVASHQVIQLSTGRSWDSGFLVLPSIAADEYAGQKCTFPLLHKGKGGQEL